MAAIIKPLVTSRQLAATKGDKLTADSGGQQLLHVAAAAAAAAPSAAAAAAAAVAEWINLLFNNFWLDLLITIISHDFFLFFSRRTMHAAEAVVTLLVHAHSPFVPYEATTRYGQEAWVSMC